MENLEQRWSFLGSEILSGQKAFYLPTTIDAEGNGFMEPVWPQAVITGPGHGYFHPGSMRTLARIRKW